MMITIHGLPINVKYQDLKALIKRECKITDFILDHLVPEGNGNKKVRMGLANNNEGNHVIKCLNGYRLAGHILQVTPVGKSLDFQSQQQNTYSTSQPRVDPWNNESNQSQWSNSRQQQQDTYNYPSKVVNQQTRSQFDQKTSILGRIVPPSQGFSISPKNATAQAGTQARQGFLRTVEIIDTAQNTTQGHQNYDSSQDRPTIIMKDHFQGGQYIVTPQQSSGHYQERQSWGQQVASKSDLFTKNERISYGNRQDKGELIKDFVEETQKLHFQGRSHDVLPPARMDIHTQSRRFSPSNRPVSPTTRPISPSNRHMSPSGRRLSPSSRRMSPNGRRMSPSGSRISSSGRRLSQSARRTSPSGSRMSPSGRRLSPSARRMSPNSRRMSPSVRRESTSGRPVSPNARRVSPSGRRMLSSVRTSSSMYRPMSPSEKGVLTSFAPFSSSDRHVMQSGRQISPFGRSGMPNQSMKSIDSLSKPLSPSRRQISPERKMFLPERTMHGRHISSPIRKPTMSERNIPARRDDMRQMSPLNRSKPERYSPTRCFEDSRSVKQVRPAYDPASDSNQAMYSGAFRPNDSLQYSSKGREERPDSWSNRINEHNKAHVEERRDKVRMSKFEPARPIDHPREIDEVMKRSVSRNRESRSPRRDRSPLRDRFKRHSPSPRSPRRSWALEKRRSPEDADIPPPPSWPGQDHNRLLKDIRDKRDHFPQRVEESRGATWDMNKYEPIQDEGREIRTIADDRRPFERPVITVRKDLEKWKPIDNDSPKRSPPRYKPEENERALRRKDIESRFEDFRAQNERKACSDRREFEEPRRDEERRFKSDFTNAAELSKIKEELTRRIEKKTEILKKQEELQKEIEYVYKRATDFTKKAEYKKCDRRHDDYKEHRRLDDLDPKEFDLPTLTRLKEERRDRNLDRVESRKKEMDETLRSDVPNADGIRVKRHKAAEAIADKIFDKFGGMLPKDITKCVKNELKLFILKILKRIFGEEDVSFIEMIIKFNSKHSTKDEEDIYDSIMAGFPNQYRNLKRLAKDEPSEVPAKISKPSSVSQVDKESKSRYKDPLPQRKEAGASKHLLKSTETKLHRVEKEKIIEEKPKAISKEDATASSVKKHSQEEIEAMFPTQLSQDNKELDPSTAKILEYELRHIMIKVWQEFPDDPPTEEEMYVAEKFRNEAGDDIRNVIGLNVSKRLLNTYNKLIVKVRFSCRPEKLNLLAFLKKYRITGFKRITSATNTFAALLKNIDDFDKICSEKEISCGNAKLTITPCYNFMKRPSHLKTKFVDETDNETVTEAKVAQENFGKEIAEIKPNTEVKEAPKDTVIKEASQNKIERDDNKQTPTRDEVSVAKDIQGKSTKSDHITKVSNITPTNKSQDKSNISNKKVVGEKPTQKSLQEKVTAKPITNETAKSTVTSTKNNTAITQSQKVQTPQNKSQTKGNSIKSVQVKETPKVIKKIDVKDATFKTTESKVKQKVNKKVAVKKKEVKSTNQIKRIPMSKVQKNKKGIIDKYNDYDEMDDDDILAFLADGVVMDECSTDEE